MKVMFSIYFPELFGQTSSLFLFKQRGKKSTYLKKKTKQVECYNENVADKTLLFLFLNFAGSKK